MVPMVNYSKFVRVLVAGHTLDVVLALDHAGILSEQSAGNSDIHTGADAVVFLTSSLTREIALYVTDAELIVEAGLAAMCVLNQESHHCGVTGPIDFECRQGAIRGLPHVEKSDSVRVSWEDNSAAALEALTVAGTDARVVSVGSRTFHFGNSEAGDAGTEIRLLKQSDEAVSLSAPSTKLPPLRACLAALEALVAEECVYHTFVLGIAGAQLSVVYQGDDRKVTLSLKPKRLFKAELFG